MCECRRWLSWRGFERVAFVLAAVGGAVAPGVSWAVVTSVGQVNPAPPAGGGAIAGPLVVGDTLVGVVTIGGGTAVSLTTGNVLVGNGAAGLGSISLSGFGSNLSTATVSDVLIGVAGSGTVSVEALAQINVADDLTIGVSDGSSGSLEIDGFGTIVDVNDALFVGQAGVGLVEVTDGGRVLADDVVLAQGASGDARVTMVGAQTLWRQTNSLTVADGGRAVLEVFDGARIETTNVVAGNLAEGVATIDVVGTGAVWDVTGFMNLGVAGESTLRVRDGGRIVNTGAVRMATTSGGESRAAVSGLGAMWQVGTTMAVGEVGFGTLEITGGGRISSGNVILADGPVSRADVTVEGEGSTWTITGSLDVSDPGEAALTISDGGLVTTSSVARIAAAGELVLRGGRLHAGSTGLTNQGVVRGAGRINGALANAASGEVRVAAGEALVLGSLLSNSGLVDLDGGELETIGAASNSGDIAARNAVLRFQTGLINSSGGQVAITGGAVDVYGAVSNAAGAEIVVGGQAHAVFHDAVTNNGDLYIMPGADVLMLEDLSFGAASLLSIGLNSAALEECFTPLETAGSTTLAGVLQVELAGGLAPQLGDSFQLIAAAGGRTGTFGTTMLPALGAGLAWDLDYNPQSVLLSVVAAPGGFAADFDGDNDVDGMDLAKWKTGHGLTSGAAKVDGDADADGDVDGADFIAWQRELGSGVPATAVVPEPSTTCLVLAACLAGLAWRRRD